MTRARISLLLALLLCACGGGDFDEPETTRAGIQPVDCQATPEACR